LKKYSNFWFQRNFPNAAADENAILGGTQMKVTAFPLFTPLAPASSEPLVFEPAFPKDRFASSAKQDPIPSPAPQGQDEAWRTLLVRSFALEFLDDSVKANYARRVVEHRDAINFSQEEKMRRETQILLDGKEVQQARDYAVRNPTMLEGAIEDVLPGLPWNTLNNLQQMDPLSRKSDLDLLLRDGLLENIGSSKEYQVLAEQFVKTLMEDPKAYARVKANEAFLATKLDYSREQLLTFRPQLRNEERFVLLAQDMRNLRDKIDALSTAGEKSAAEITALRQQLAKKAETFNKTLQEDFVVNISMIQNSEVLPPRKEGETLEEYRERLKGTANLERIEEFSAWANTISRALSLINPQLGFIFANIAQIGISIAIVACSSGIPPVMIAGAVIAGVCALINLFSGPPRNDGFSKMMEALKTINQNLVDLRNELINLITFGFDAVQVRLGKLEERLIAISQDLARISGQENIIQAQLQEIQRLLLEARARSQRSEAVTWNAQMAAESLPFVKNMERLRKENPSELPQQYITEMLYSFVDHADVTARQPFQNALDVLTKGHAWGDQTFLETLDYRDPCQMHGLLASYALANADIPSPVRQRYFKSEIDLAQYARNPFEFLRGLWAAYEIPKKFPKDYPKITETQWARFKLASAEVGACEQFFSDPDVLEAVGLRYLNAAKSLRGGFLHDLDRDDARTKIGLPAQVDLTRGIDQFALQFTEKNPVNDESGKKMQPSQTARFLNFPTFLEQYLLRSAPLNMFVINPNKNPIANLAHKILDRPNDHEQSLMDFSFLSFQPSDQYFLPLISQVVPLQISPQIFLMNGPAAIVQRGQVLGEQDLVTTITSSIRAEASSNNVLGRGENERKITGPIFEKTISITTRNDRYPEYVFALNVPGLQKEPLAILTVQLHAGFTREQHTQVEVRKSIHRRHESSFEFPGEFHTENAKENFDMGKQMAEMWKQNLYPDVEKIFGEVIAYLQAHGELENVESIAYEKNGTDLRFYVIVTYAAAADAKPWDKDMQKEFIMQLWDRDFDMCSDPKMSPPFIKLPNWHEGLMIMHPTGQAHSYSANLTWNKNIQNAEAPFFSRHREVLEEKQKRALRYFSAEIQREASLTQEAFQQLEAPRRALLCLLQEGLTPLDESFPAVVNLRHAVTRLPTAAALQSLALVAQGNGDRIGDYLNAVDTCVKTAESELTHALAEYRKFHQTSKDRAFIGSAYSKQANFLLERSGH